MKYIVTASVVSEISSEIDGFYNFCVAFLLIRLTNINSNWTPCIYLAI